MQGPPFVNKQALFIRGSLQLKKLAENAVHFFLRVCLY